LGANLGANFHALLAVIIHSFSTGFPQPDSRKAAAHRMTVALQARANGFDHWTGADVLGHDKGSLPLAMTMHTYAGPSSMKARKAAIESIFCG
jgi:hypothetical protein